MNKVGKTMAVMAGVGAASFLSYKYLVPKNKKEQMGNMVNNMMNNNSSGNN